MRKRPSGGWANRPGKGEVWNTNIFELREQAVIELAGIIEDGGDAFTFIGPDAWSASDFFIIETWQNWQDPYKMALVAFGATREQCDDTSTPFGLAFQRTLLVTDVLQGRRTGSVENALYVGACEPHNTAAQKLYLQAHKPEKYVPVTKSKVTVEEIVKALSEASDEDVKRAAGIED